MYEYRREDTDEIVSVDFDTHMAQVAGFITLPDGVTARRVQLSNLDSSPSEKRQKVQAEIVSDTLGVTAAAVNEFRENAKQYGFTGVSFTPDPTEPTFYQARFSSWAEKARYAEFRGMGVDRNSKNGSAAALTPEQFERAKQRLLEAHS